MISTGVSLLCRRAALVVRTPKLELSDMALLQQAAPSITTQNQAHVHLSEDWCHVAMCDDCRAYILRPGISIAETIILCLKQ
jgi:hypothetical protein